MNLALLHHPWKARIYLNSAQTITTGGVTVNLDTVDYDPNGNLDTSAHNYTIPINGYYQVSWSVTTAAAASNTQLFARLQQNGTDATAGTRYYTNALAATSAGSDVVQCVAGDLLTIKATTVGANAAASLSVITNYMAIHFLSAA